MRKLVPGTLIIFCVAFVTLAWSDEAGDRAAIARLVDNLKATTDKTSLFEPGAENEMPSPPSPMTQRPWSEQIPPVFVLRSLRFITADVALADIDYAYGSSAALIRVPLLLVLTREGKDWRVASLRKLAQKR